MQLKVTKLGTKFLDKIMPKHKMPGIRSIL